MCCLIKQKTCDFSCTSSFSLGGRLIRSLCVISKKHSFCNLSFSSFIKTTFPLSLFEQFSFLTWCTSLDDDGMSIQKTRSSLCFFFLGGKCLSTSLTERKRKFSLQGNQQHRRRIKLLYSFKGRQLLDMKRLFLCALNAFFIEPFLPVCVYLCFFSH